MGGIEGPRSVRCTRSDLKEWISLLDRLLQLELDVMATGRTYPTPRFDPRKQVHETRQQFGVYFSPWFKPFHTEFRY